MTTTEFLQIIGERLRSSLSIKDFVVLSHLYADCAGIKKARQKPKAKKPKPAEKPEPTMSEVILQLERESKNGQ